MVWKISKEKHSYTKVRRKKSNTQSYLRKTKKRTTKDSLGSVRKTNKKTTKGGYRSVRKTNRDTVHFCQKENPRKVQLLKDQWERQTGKRKDTQNRKRSVTEKNRKFYNT